MQNKNDNPIIVYIINLEKDFKRKERIENELRSVGWTNYEFIKATPGADLPNTKEMIETGILDKTFIDPNGLLTKNVIACALSHKSAYNAFMKSNYEYAIILEDDIEFTQYGLKTMLAGFMNHIIMNELINNPMIKNTWESFFFGLVGTYIPNHGLVKDCNLLHQYKRHNPDWAAHAYLINKRSVDKLIKNNTPIRYAADVNIECAHSEIYCSEHSMILQLAGKYSRFETSRLLTLYGQLLHDREYHSLTTEILNKNVVIQDFYFNPEKEKTYESASRECIIADEILFKSVEWKDSVDSTGKKIIKWTHIHF
jgi:GR25 family glycosyltransferase involved in LPS biosynthesis